MGMMEELTALGKEIESAKKSVAQLEGRREEILERIKNDFGAEDLEEAGTILDSMSADLDKMEHNIEKGFSELKEKFTW